VGKVPEAIQLLDHIAHELCDLAQFEDAVEVYLQMQRLMRQIMAQAQGAADGDAVRPAELKGIVNLYAALWQADLLRLPEHLRRPLEEGAPVPGSAEDESYFALASVIGLHRRLRDNKAIQRDAEMALQTVRRDGSPATAGTRCRCTSLSGSWRLSACNRALD
jgi:hypothetical protein